MVKLSFLFKKILAFCQLHPITHECIILYIKSTCVCVCLYVRAVSRHCPDLCFFFFLMGFVFLVDCRSGGRILQWVLFSWSIVAMGEEFYSEGRILQLPVPLCRGCFWCCNQQGVAAADDSWQDLDHGESLSSQ